MPALQLPQARLLALARRCVEIIDNDQVTGYADGEEGEKVFDMHPADLMEQLLDRVGIPHEPVLSRRPRTPV